MNNTDTKDSADSDNDPGLPSVGQLTAAIRHRRTIKTGNMSDRPVSRADLELILENGNWAPSHGQTEPWRFKVFEGESRNELGRALSHIYKTVTPPASFLESKFTKLAERPGQAAVAIVIWMRRQEVKKIPEIEEVGAVACAVQNMHLTASTMGMAAFWSSPKVIYTPEMTAWLGIGEDDRCLGILYVGWPAEHLVWPTGNRKPVDEKIEWMANRNDR